MAKDRLWREVTLRVPIDVEQGKYGQWYVTSPWIRGLLIADKDRAAAIAQVPQTIQDHAVAAADLNEGAR